MAHTYHPSTWEAEVEELILQVSLDYILSYTLSPLQKINSFELKHVLAK